MDQASTQKREKLHHFLSEFGGELTNLGSDMRQCLGLRAALRSMPLVTHEDVSNFSETFLATMRSAHVLSASIGQNENALAPQRLDAGRNVQQLEDLQIRAIPQAFVNLIEGYKDTEDLPHVVAAARMAALGSSASIQWHHDETSEDVFFRALFLDLDVANSSKDAGALQNIALWHAEKLHDDTTTALAKLKEIVETDQNGAWDYFWEWYIGVLDGKPIDWDLQQRVALIKDDTWKAGRQAVADEIERLRIKIDLEKRIAELEAELRRATSNRHGIGGNMPPETIDETAIVQQMTILLVPVQSLKTEIDKSDPDPERLSEIIATLLTALRQGYAWCLKKADLLVDTAIKWAVPTGGTGYLALNPEKIEAVVETAKRLLNAL